MHADAVEALKEKLATRFRQLQEQQGVSGVDLEKRTTHDRKNVSAIRNRGRLPTRDILRAYDREFGTGSELTDLGDRIRAAQKALRLDRMARAAGVDTSEPPRAQSDEEVNSTDRRQVMELGALSALALSTQQRMDAAVADTTLDELEADADEIARIYGSAPHASLLPEVGGRWRQVRDILDGPVTPLARSRVTTLGGQFSYFLGRLAFNVGDMRSARRFAGLGARYSAEVGDPVLILSIAALRSSVAYWQQDYHKALALLRAVTDVSDPYMDARVAAYEARTYAALGDAPAARAALDRMDATAGAFTPRPGSTPVGPAGVAMFRAGVALTLQDGGAAREWAPLAVSSYQQRGGDYSVEEAQHATLMLALTHLAGPSPEPEEAARLAASVLTARMAPTHTTAGKIRRIGQSFTADHQRLPAVVTFTEAYRALPAGSAVR
ncbi:hypothetical protein [Frankia sp. CcI49]|uniref:hypothetical protein n=1 Tax=Frankia sp. CcI49 TaxID=1745382 RepID=UPI001055D9C6|nr:hypothetical protein [Frankia sp. CcI49]